MGACQYCGQAIQGHPLTQRIDPGPAPGTKSLYSWQDWPATTAPPAGNTHPTLPTLNAPGEPPAWDSFNDAGDDPTELGPSPFAAGSVPPPGAVAFTPGAGAPGTAPFLPAHAPPPGAPLQPGLPPTNAIPFPAGSAPPFAGMGAAPVYPPAAPARPQRRRTVFLAAVAVCVLIALIVGGLLLARSFTPATTSATSGRPGTPAASPTATVPVTQVYRDPKGRFTISYPTAWNAQPISQKLGVLPLTLEGAQFQGGQASLKVLTGQTLPLLSDQAAQADTALLQLMGGHNITSAEPKHIGGQTWTTKQAEANNGDRLVATSITYQGELYSIIYSAPKAEFSQDEKQTFTPMLKSFIFGV